MTSEDKTKTLLNKATTDDRNPPSGYLLKELSSRTISITECETIEALVIKKLAKNKPYIKYKALRIIIYFCDNGSHHWRRLMQHNKDILRDAKHFQGPPDPIFGDALYQQVRKAANDAILSAFQQPQRRCHRSVDYSRINIKNRIKGYDGNTPHQSKPKVSRPTLTPVSVLNSQRSILSSNDEYEKRWIDAIVKGGGVGWNILDVHKYVQQFENLNKRKVLQYLNEKLKECTDLKAKAKALTLMEALMKGRSCQDVMDYLNEYPQNVKALQCAKQSIIRRKANTVIKYLNVLSVNDEEDEDNDDDDDDDMFKGMNTVNVDKVKEVHLMEFEHMNKASQEKHSSKNTNIIDIMDIMTNDTMTQTQKDINVTQNDDYDFFNDKCAIGFDLKRDREEQNGQNDSVFGSNLGSINTKQNNNGSNQNYNMANMNPMMRQLMLNQNKQKRQFIQNMQMNMNTMNNVQNVMQQMQTMQVKHNAMNITNPNMGTLMMQQQNNDSFKEAMMFYGL